MDGFITALGKKLLPPALRFHLRVIKACPQVQWAYLKRGEPAKASRGLRVYGSVLANFLSGLKLLPARRLCEFCGWSGRYFVPLYYVDCYHAEAFCPACRLMDRYRTLVHFTRRSEWGARVRKLNPRVLDVAPTEISATMLKKEFCACESIGFDISNPWADVIGDLQRMPFDSDSFDFILCYEVLDYIPRDDLALCELYRVLKKDCYAVLQVAFSTELETTIDYAQPDPDDSFHIRKYGKDLFERFRRAGFEYELVEATSGLDEVERERFGLDEHPIILLHRPAAE